MRPHGLVELAFGNDLVLFSTFFPRWVNLSILWSFLEPMIPRTHFGVDVRGWYNGGEIGSRPMQCENGFFMQVRFLSAPFLLSELYRSAPMHVACLHTVNPRTDDREEACTRYSHHSTCSQSACISLCQWVGSHIVMNWNLIPSFRRDSPPLSGLSMHHNSSLIWGWSK